MKNYAMDLQISLSNIITISFIKACIISCSLLVKLISVAHPHKPYKCNTGECQFNVNLFQTISIAEADACVLQPILFQGINP